MRGAEVLRVADETSRVDRPLEAKVAEGELGALVAVQALRLHPPGASGRLRIDAIVAVDVEVAAEGIGREAVDGGAGGFAADGVDRGARLTHLLRGNGRRATCRHEHEEGGHYEDEAHAPRGLVALFEEHGEVKARCIPRAHVRAVDRSPARKNAAPTNGSRCVATRSHRGVIRDASSG